MDDPAAALDEEVIDQCAVGSDRLGPDSRRSGDQVVGCQTWEVAPHLAVRGPPDPVLEELGRAATPIAASEPPGSREGGESDQVPWVEGAAVVRFPSPSENGVGGREAYDRGTLNPRDLVRLAAF